MWSSSKFKSIVNLGKHPLVNRLVEKKKFKTKRSLFSTTR